MEQTILNILREATPIGAVVLSLIIILQLIRQKEEVKELKDNHLHDIPEIAETLLRIEQKIEKMNDNIIWIKSKINGK